MGFRPDKAGVDNANFIQTSQFLQAQRQQLAGLGHGRDPAHGREQPSVAVAAEVERRLALDALGDVDGQLDAVVAERAGGGRAVDGRTAVAAEDPGGAESVGVSRRNGAGMDVRCPGLLLRDRSDRHGRIINIHRHLVGIIWSLLDGWITRPKASLSRNLRRGRESEIILPLCLISHRWAYRRRATRTECRCGDMQQSEYSTRFHVVDNQDENDGLVSKKSCLTLE